MMDKDTMPDYTITKITEEPTLAHGIAGARLRVEFTVGDDGPFFERFEKTATFDFDVSQRLGEFARRIRSVRT
jgi:hypothetical protein